MARALGPAFMRLDDMDPTYRSRKLQAIKDFARQHQFYAPGYEKFALKSSVGDELENQEFLSDEQEDEDMELSQSQMNDSDLYLEAAMRAAADQQDRDGPEVDLEQIQLYYKVVTVFNSGGQRVWVPAHVRKDDRKDWADNISALTYGSEMYNGHLCQMPWKIINELRAEQVRLMFHFFNIVSFLSVLG